MAFKERKESNLLKLLRVLNSRMELPEDTKRYYYNLEKGFQGELQFDRLTEKLRSNCYVLNDLLLKYNNSEFQLDTVIIYQETIYALDVKNHEGDYCFESEKLVKIGRKEVQNPLNQLNRAKSLFRQLLDSLGCKLNVEAYVIFINLEFTLYQLPPDFPFIMPTQITSFLKKLDAKPSVLNSSHKKLAEKLLSLHIIEPPPYSRYPIYDLGMIKPGMSCKNCYSLSTTVEKSKFICKVCDFEEPIEAAVVRNVEELRLLFPERKITTNLVYEWCKIIECKKRISRILMKNYRRLGSRNTTYFE
ncbi:nuclease-related domain-containing protein [Pseudoneobacillus sp. C159]